MNIRFMRRSAIVSVVQLVLVAFVASTAMAQSAVGSVRGVVYDSLSGRPLAGATVDITGSSTIAVSDKQGRFRIDSVAAGPQRISFAATALDSIGLFGFARDVTIRANAEQEIMLSVPSLHTVHQQLCAPSAKPQRDSAIVFGTIYDASTRKKVEKVDVRFAWFSVSIEGGVRLVEAERHALSGADGTYGVCGLPSDLALTTRASNLDAASGRITTIVGDARIMRRDIYISREQVVPQPAASNLPPDRARGSANVRGTIRDERGKPLVGALVVVADGDTTVRSDDAGKYVVRGLAAGTQAIGVRQIGLGAVTTTLSLVSDSTVDADFTLAAATVLSTVNVRANARPGADQAGFMTRKKSGFGSFIEREEILKRVDLAGVLRRMSGLIVQGSGTDLQIRSTRRGCQPDVFIDGIPAMRMSSGSTIPIAGSVTPTNISPLAGYNPRDILAVEFYQSLGAMPLQFSTGKPSECGVLLVWTTLSHWN